MKHFWFSPQSMLFFRFWMVHFKCLSSLSSVFAFSARSTVDDCAPVVNSFKAQMYHQHCPMMVLEHSNLLVLQKHCCENTTVRALKTLQIIGIFILIAVFNMSCKESETKLGSDGRDQVFCLNVCFWKLLYQGQRESVFCDLRLRLRPFT